MTRRIVRDKWILYRHTRNFDTLCVVAEYLKNYTKASITYAAQKKLVLKLRNMGLYNERNKDIPLDAINHKINTLAYYMFGYKSKIDGEKMFLFSPLGNLFLRNLDNSERLKKIFLTMLWAMQYPDPHFGTSRRFKVYPFRLIFKLILDNRLEKRLFAYEVAYLVVFVDSIDDEKYEELVKNMLTLRTLSNEELKDKFTRERHTYVNSVYEWDYYVSELFQSAGLLEKTEGELICRLKHGNTNTYRKVTRNYVKLSDNLIDFCIKLLEKFPHTDTPLKLDDPERLTLDVVKEIYSFYPKLLLIEIGDESEGLGEQLSTLLELPKLIEHYSLNQDKNDPFLFEEVLEKGFNFFYNVQAKRIGGAGKTDIECLYISKKKKFAVDAKSSSTKLAYLNAKRLALHRELIGGEYTIVVTPAYVPAVKTDIKSTKVVILGASTFSEYLYNNIVNNVREIDYEDFDNIINSKLGTDISPEVSKLTITKFGVKESK